MDLLLTQQTRKPHARVVLIGVKQDEFEVVDGQQRLATTAMILAAIRDYFYENGDRDRANDIQSEYLMRRDLRSQEIIPKIRLNDIDGEYFVGKVLAPPGDPRESIQPFRVSHNRLFAASKLVREFIDKTASLTNDPANELIDLVSYLFYNVKVIRVKVSNDADAFTIFETLNDRGLDLATTDLLKNRLFSLARTRIGDVQERWSSIFATLEPHGGEATVLSFVRHLWISRYGVTRKNDLYTKIKATITSSQRAVDFAGELARYSVHYAALVSPEEEFWDGTYGLTTRNAVATLNILGMEQMRPLMLAVLEKFDAVEVRRSFRLMVSWAVRLLADGTLGGGVAERQYADRAIDVREGRINTTSELGVAMANFIPQDEKFRSAFEVMTVSRNNVARYYLSTLELIASGSTNPTMVVSPDTKAVTLEHVLPENPSAAWSHITPDEAQAYFERLGNLALLGGKPNWTLGNTDFAMKAAAYEVSGFRLTQEIAKQPVWGVREIEGRQKRLARLALTAWKL